MVFLMPSKAIVKWFAGYEENIYLAQRTLNVIRQLQLHFTLHVCIISIAFLSTVLQYNVNSLLTIGF